MIRPDLTVTALGDLPGGPEPVVLCASARLAVELRRTHGELQAARGAATWRALQASTPALWLDALVSSALLSGEVPADAVGGGFLTRSQEAVLWEAAIGRDAGAAAELFDREGMAEAAMEAAALQRAWRIEVPETLRGAEFQAFQRWQQDVAAQLKRGGWRGSDELLPWRIDCIARGAGRLPVRVGLAGFIAPDPMLSRLLAVLEARGTELFRVEFGLGSASAAQAMAAADAEAECRAAAAWARRRFDEGARRLRIAVADPSARRAALEVALADTLHPDRIGAAWADAERDFEFAGGLPLASAPLVDVALRLLQMLVAPRRIALADISVLLCAPGWSADNTEADARAAIDRRLRESLPLTTDLDRLQRALGRLDAEGIAVPHLLADLASASDVQRRAPRRQLPSAWGATFTEALAACGWPGERAPLATEVAACAALRERLQELRVLDEVLGRIDASEALRQVRRQCRDRALIVPRRSALRVEVCALGEAVAGTVDGLWVLGLNEGVWPPAPRPNPLLPAELQRRTGIPAARADLLADHAAAMLDLWCRSAPEVVLSWAQGEGDRPLRPSPLLVGIAANRAPVPAEGGIVVTALETLIDDQAPPLGVGEPLRGGTRLLAAQAACPAWAFHEFRLGATALPRPAAVLDARMRGNLLHAALEAFWRGRGLAALRGMNAASRAAEIACVVEHALARHEREAAEPLPTRLRRLEVRRLAELVDTWLGVEAQRADFEVEACEERHRLVIEGLPVAVVVDRVDRLADGRLAIIDYKTGRNDKSAAWARKRISEPQLPIYAALAFPDREVAAVVLARVLRDGPGFAGVAADNELLPGVKALDAQRRRYGAEEFPDWPTLRRVWADRIAALAREVRDGVAGVVVADPKALAHCPVMPILRLAEDKAAVDEGETS